METDNKKYFTIVQLSIENFKKIRAVEIRPEGRRIVEITGANGQGKSTAIQAIDFAITGVKALPARKGDAVRNGTDRARITVDCGDFKVIRTIGKEGNQPTLRIDPPEVTDGLTPQKFLDQFFSALTFDPLQFLDMTPKEQVAELQKAARVDIDFDKIATDNKIDYEERTILNREINILDAQRKGIQLIEPLPKQKINEAAIAAKITAATAENSKAYEGYQQKQMLNARAASLRSDVERAGAAIATKNRLIESLKAQLKEEEENLKGLKADEINLTKEWKEAVKQHDATPEVQIIDIDELTRELTAAQRTNRAIDDRTRWEKLNDQVKAKELASDQLTRRMQIREEKKAAAIANAKIPVPGLTFDQSEVRFEGTTLDNLGEGEQIRIATLIGMAANPRLRIICIRRGEALDGRNLKVLADLAEQFDFQIWMAKVDTSGTAGFVLEDGLVVKRNAAVSE